MHALHYTLSFEKTPAYKMLQDTGLPLISFLVVLHQL